MKFDVNEKVKVKLTDAGKNELRRQHEELRSRVQSILPYTNPIEDEKGYSTWQLWVLMSTFGHIMVNGGDVPFNTEIIILGKGDNG